VNNKKQGFPQDLVELNKIVNNSQKHLLIKIALAITILLIVAGILISLFIKLPILCYPIFIHYHSWLDIIK